MKYQGALDVPLALNISLPQTPLLMGLGSASDPSALAIPGGTNEFIAQYTLGNAALIDTSVGLCFR